MPSIHYFDTITDASAFKKYRPPGSKWSDGELFAARLVVRSATARPDINHLLPNLRDHFAEAATACDQKRIRELLKPADASYGTLTDTELVHLHGASLGSFWAALAQFGHLEGREVEAKDDGVDEAEDDDDMDMYMGAGEGGGRRRPNSPGLKMQVGSSLYSKSSSQQASQGSGYVSQGHPSADVPEQGTVQIASAFIRYVLQACPPQHETQRRQPTRLVEFSGKSRKFAGKTSHEEKVRATADGELVLHQRGNGRYNLTSHRPALLEAKKRFAVINDGEPAFTNEFLGQMTCEALAFRLQRCQTPGDGPVDERVFIIAAVRQYMRFLQFGICDSYLASLTSEDEMTDFMDAWATQWFDLQNPGQRRSAVENIVALVARQATLG
ncbi:hypothetical protein B0T25DRAFT_580523 [Lasiosphaeria hispida]|uniref:Uncharacterized protein n=1 Tax=Lasiosphaeria hispida TaxID=260671 RepID=A0AAJ0HHQ3_9PEZI|nr:hypothetical protein B0T25DRAFT_580523 [Lasiosphaeria hispida]